MHSVYNNSVDVKFFLRSSLVALVLSVIIWRIVKHFFRSKANFPPGPNGLPIVGYMPFLGKEPFRKLHNLSKLYGNVFSLYLGKKYVVILGDYEAVKDAFSKSTTIDRPVGLFDFIPGGVGFSEFNGQEWVEQRKFSVRTMRDLGFGKGPWETLLLDEVRDFIGYLKDKNGEAINICQHLSSSVTNNMMSLVIGKRLPIESSDRDFLDKCINAALLGTPQAGMKNYFPGLHDLLVRWGFFGLDKEKQLLVNFNNYIKNHIEDIKMESKNDAQDNYVTRYLKVMENGKNIDRTTFNNSNLCGNVQALLLGGSDTTKSSLNWLLLAMAEHPEVQKRVQEELDRELGPRSFAAWDDRTKLPFTFATIMEGQRWKTLAPLNTSRIAQEDIQICNYDIPQGSVIIANNWGLHNDTRYWTHPEKFEPSRFIKEDGTVNTKPDSYVPFSYGKRMCPGDTVAMMEMLLYFSALLSHFDIVSAEENQKPNLDALLGLTYHAVDQKMCLKPRSIQT